MERDYRTIHSSTLPRRARGSPTGRFFGKGRVVFGGRTQRGSTASAKDDLSHIRSRTGCHAWITSAAEERNGTIWLETSDGKHARITNGNVEAVNANTPGKNAIVDFRDRGGNLWTMGQGHDLLRFIDYPSSGRLERLSFFSLGEDREGNLWFGTTAQGLCRLRRQWASFARRRAGPGGRAQTWRSSPPSPTTNQSAA